MLVFLSVAIYFHSWRYLLRNAVQLLYLVSMGVVAFTFSAFSAFSENKISELNMTLQNTKVERKTGVKYFGVYVDENLKWQSYSKRGIDNQ